MIRYGARSHRDSTVFAELGRRPLRWCPILGAVLLLLAAGGHVAKPAGAEAGMASLRIVHTSPDAGTVDVTVGSQTVAQGLTFAATSETRPVPGGAVPLLVTATGETSRVLLQTTVELLPDRAFTVVLTGLNSGSPRLGAAAFPDYLGETGSGRARLRLVNAAVGAGPATLTTAEGGILLTGIDFGATGDTVLDAGRLSLRVVGPVTDAPPLAETTLPADQGRTYTLVLIGQAGGPMPLALLIPGRGRPATTAGAPRMPVGPGGVLVEESFADPMTGLLPTMAPTGSTLLYGYVDGEYFLRNLEVATQSLPLPGDDTNATIAADVRLLGETTRRTVSVGCRFTSDGAGNRGYRLRVEPAAGVFRLVREDGNRDFFLRNDRVSSAIRRGNETNRLELTCSGSTITAVINGTEVASVQDRTYTSGPLAIGVGARADGLTSEARFDNLVVTQR